MDNQNNLNPIESEPTQTPYQPQPMAPQMPIEQPPVAPMSFNAPEVPKKSNKKLMIIIAIIVALLLIGGALYYFLTQTKILNNIGGTASTSRKCTVNEDLENLGNLGTRYKFVDGQYTYTYSEKGWRLNAGSITTKTGWEVQLTDRDSTTPVTTKLCSAINDVPIVSMNNMFLASQAISIDLSSFDTSNVETMYGMFDGVTVKELDLSKFNTSNVKDMSQMFSSIQNIPSISLSNFDTSNVEKMGWMFDGSSFKYLDLTSFNTSKVKDMAYMFNNCKADTIDISSFDLSNIIGIKIDGSSSDMIETMFSDYPNAAQKVYVKSQDVVENFIIYTVNRQKFVVK